MVAGPTAAWPLSALMRAACKGHIDSVRALLEHGSTCAYPNATDRPRGHGHASRSSQGTTRPCTDREIPHRACVVVQADLSLVLHLMGRTLAVVFVGFALTAMSYKRPMWRHSPANLSRPGNAKTSHSLFRGVSWLKRAAKTAVLNLMVGGAGLFHDGL